MKIVRIQYTAKLEFVETNKSNIQKVMDELKSKGVSDVRYSVYLLPDGKSFMHYVVMKDEDSNKVIVESESFKNFQQQLMASGPEVSPKQEVLTPVGSSYELLG